MADEALSLKADSKPIRQPLRPRAGACSSLCCRVSAHRRRLANAVATEGFHGRSGATPYRRFHSEPSAFERASGNEQRSPGHPAAGVDQLQVVQDQLIAQRAETKRLSDQNAALTENSMPCSN